MQLSNLTVFPAAWTLGFAGDGRELAIVIAKATYAFDACSGEVAVSKSQSPLVKSDEFTGAPGASAVLYETDFAHFKPKCDVLLNGCAHAPTGKVMQWLPVGLQIGPIKKVFKVFGDRVWRAGILTTRPSDPRPFATMPISYDRAFGGVDDFDTETTPTYYLPNSVGRGYHRWTSRSLVDGTPLPNTEELDRAIEAPDADYAPMAFGAIGRNVAPRVRHAGTYDEQWLATKAPFWPDDFRHEYFQAAPLDQQMAYPTGGEILTLANLTSNGTTRLSLPAPDLAVLARFWRGSEKALPMAVDTVLLEPELGQLTMTCRVGVPMARSIFDLREVVLDSTTKLQRRQPRNGKPHYLSPADYARAKAQGRAAA